ncbi:MAG TPA: DNA polymerase I [Hyphomicrobiaceae bacterium]|jgi:DNA polymerase-1
MVTIAAKPQKSQRPGATCSVPPGEPVPVIKGSHIYLIDGSGYIFRAFHALPPLTRKSDGLPTGAVHGFCGMLWKLLQDSRKSSGPTHIAVIFDYSEKTFRNEIYHDYKAHRPPVPEELVPQFSLIRDAVKAFNIACLEQDGYEADDLIATYAKDALAAGGDVTIVSSDKDLMQLVGPGVSMLDTMKNRTIGPDEVRERFGVPPEKVVDVQALAGDSTDNVPGVPGIGVKTAAELINEYGDLDTLLERAGEIRQTKRRERLMEFALQARLSRELVQLKDDVPLGVPSEQLGVRDPDADTLMRFLREMEFTTLTKRISEGLGVAAPPPIERGEPAAAPAAAPHRPRLAAADGRAAGATAAPMAAVRAAAAAAKAEQIDRTKYETVTTLDRLETWIAEAYSTGHVAFDTETTSLDPMQAEFVGFSMAVAPGRACYVPLGHRAASGTLDFSTEPLTQVPVRDALQSMKPLLEDAAVLKIGQNLKYDYIVLARHGIILAPIEDTMLLSYALDAGPTTPHGLDALAERHLGHSCMDFAQVIEFAPGARKSDKTFAQVPLDKATQYAAEDADVALRMWMVLKPRLAAERVATVYETLERPMVRILADMERTGIKVDKAILARLTSTFAQRITRLEQEIYELAGHKFNLGSAKQLGEFLFDNLKLPGGRKTRTGQWETRAGLLDELAAREDLPDHARKLINVMLEWRQLAKLRSTYTESLPAHINPDSGRIHTSYALASTSTGRLSSNDPNLQNIPIRTKEGREIRTAFIAEAGHKLISADYSQIELRVLAHVAEIPQLRRAFAEGLDIHAMTASEMFGVPVKDMPAEVRRRAKAINFGIIYGISAFGLAAQLGIPKQEAGEYIATYFRRFPGIRDYMEATKAQAHQRGFVETIFGRRIHFPEINTRNPSTRGNLERAAINAPIQGSAADIIRRAMIRMPAALTAANLGSTHMLLQVHDELVLEATLAEVPEALTTIVRVMEEAAEPAVRLAVPVHVDAKAADNWEAAH